MCTPDPTSSALVAFAGMKQQSPLTESPQVVGQPTLGPTLHGNMPAAIFSEYQRLQLYDYAANRLRFAHPSLMSTPFALGPYGPMVDSQTGLPYGVSPFVRFDPRNRFIQEEPKPQHSYIGLIAMSILSSPDKKMVLSDIYQHILDHYPYFRNRGPGWRNSIRHNLSLNDCFIKAGRSANGKGHYWAIHPANIEDFKKGDFRRRKAQRKVRKHMGLAVPEDDDSPSPTPPPTQPPPDDLVTAESILQMTVHKVDKGVPKKRLFDVESLLAPDSHPTFIPIPTSRNAIGLEPVSDTCQCRMFDSPSPQSDDGLSRRGDFKSTLDDPEVEIDVTEFNNGSDKDVQHKSNFLGIAGHPNTAWSVPMPVRALQPGLRPVCSIGPLNIPMAVSWPTGQAMTHFLNYKAVAGTFGRPVDLSASLESSRVNHIFRRWPDKSEPKPDQKHQ